MTYDSDQERAQMLRAPATEKEKKATKAAHTIPFNWQSGGRGGRQFCRPVGWLGLGVYVLQLI